MAKYKVTVMVNNPIELTYLVEADSEEDARENYHGFEIINEEPIDDSKEKVVRVEEVKEKEE